MKDQSLLAVILASVFSGAVLTELLRLAALRYSEGVKARYQDSARAAEAARALDARRQEAHSNAAAQHAARVAGIFRNIDAIAAEILGPEVDYYDIEARSVCEPRVVAGDVVAELREVWSSHPTAEVRVAAKKLYDDVKGFYGNPAMNGEEWPSYNDRDVLLRHEKYAGELIELLHQPAPSRM